MSPRDRRERVDHPQLVDGEVGYRVDGALHAAVTLTRRRIEGASGEGHIAFRIQARAIDGRGELFSVSERTFSIMEGHIEDLAPEELEAMLEDRRQDAAQRVANLHAAQARLADVPEDESEPEDILDWQNGSALQRLDKERRNELAALRQEKDELRGRAEQAERQAQMEAERAEQAEGELTSARQEAEIARAGERVAREEADAAIAEVQTGDAID